jgi:hypothetical protein
LREPKNNRIEEDRTMPVYKIIDIVGVSDKDFSDAAKNAVEEAIKTIRGIRRAEVTKFDIKVEADKVVAYRAEVRISFEVER